MEVAIPVYFKGVSVRQRASGVTRRARVGNYFSTVLFSDHTRAWCFYSMYELVLYNMHKKMKTTYKFV